MRNPLRDSTSNDRARSTDTPRRDGEILDTNHTQKKEKKTLAVDASDGRSSARSSLEAAGQFQERSPEPRRTSKTGARPQANDTTRSTTNTSGQSEKSEMIGSISTRRRRPRSAWYCSPITFATTLLAVLLALAIFRSFSTRQLDPDGCSMSYMRAGFAKFEDFDTEHTRFASKYSLYLYREGGIDEDTRVSTKVLTVQQAGLTAY